MKQKKSVRALAVLACGAVCLTAIPLSACRKKDNRDSVVIMAEEFSGLFNPFYATSGSDMDVVGLTQLSMLATDSTGTLVAGDNEATAVKAFEIDPAESDDGESVYTFVLKNGLKFSDGKPLTMNDVMFNIYEYLDPVYTGSSTMYSVKIKGLKEYRTQEALSGDNDSESAISKDAYASGKYRLAELEEAFKSAAEEYGDTTSNNGTQTYYCEPDDVRRYINAMDEFNDVFIESFIAKPEDLTAEQRRTQGRAQLLADFNLSLETYKKELQEDFRAARESFDLNTLPYSEHKDLLSSDIIKFFIYEGKITPKYKKIAGTSRDDKEHIESFENTSPYMNIASEEDAINKLLEDQAVGAEFLTIIKYRATAGEMLTQFAAKAKSVILEKRKTDDGSLNYPYIEGVESLGHKREGSYPLGDATTVKVNNVDYKIAKTHNADGTPQNADEYDVLRITVEGVDPKAKFNFGFSVAPAHYYSDQPVDIENNKFGVPHGDSDFQSKVIQSQRNVEVPMGAGPYKATNSANEDNPAGDEFWRNNYVYYKANDNFMFEVKTKKLQYQYVSSSNALDKLANREIDFVTPQFTMTNSERLKEMEKDGFKKLNAWQLGYGYVGINAGKVPNLYIRRAIMAAMETELATGYYEAGTCVKIDWPMSNQSWAYPTNSDGSSKQNGHAYTQWDKKGGNKDAAKEAAKAKINDLVEEARTHNSSTVNLKIKFTIAGASITEHPTYNVFKQAAEILNECGWDVEVKADSQALTKLATGSLEVWAAAWGSTIDPDMYQVYHKNSTATSVYAWGYREIFADETSYSEEVSIINDLSDLIDDARAIDDSTPQGKATRIAKYEEAMGLVLDLAVEMPVYQRQNLYAYDAKRITGINENVNPFTSPLEKIWEIELVK